MHNKTNTNTEIPPTIDQQQQNHDLRTDSSESHRGLTAFYWRQIFMTAASNSADSDRLLGFAASRLGLHCLFFLSNKWNYVLAVKWDAYTVTTKIQSHIL